jgi:hypothetical protein
MDLKKLIITISFILYPIIALPKQAPVIGIYTQTVDTSSLSLNSASNLSYIAASYVKYIQMSGAQVVPIFAYSNRTYFDHLLPQLNGILFTGINYSMKGVRHQSISTTFGHRMLITFSNMPCSKIIKAKSILYGELVWVCNY